LGGIVYRYVGGEQPTPVAVAGVKAA
jgi:hypothetical protein